MLANLENSAVATGLENVSFHFSPKERQCQRMFKKHTIALFSYASKVMLKILQTRPQQNVNQELLDVQAGFRKGGGTRDQIAKICQIIEKATESQKSIYFCLIDCAKTFWLYGSQQTVENSERDMNIRPPYLPPEKSVCRSRSNS